MATFLIYYSNSYRAKEQGLPLAGTSVKIESLADLNTLAKSMGSKLIVPFDGYGDYAPYWADFLDVQDEEECAESHHVTKLPKGWEKMLWIEVYNGYRE